MKRARWVVIVLAVVFVVALSAVSIHIYRRHGSNQQTADNEDAAVGSGFPRSGQTALRAVKFYCTINV